MNLPIADSASKKFLVALANSMGDKDRSTIYEITRQNAAISSRTITHSLTEKSSVTQGVENSKL